MKKIISQKLSIKTFSYLLVLLFSNTLFFGQIYSNGNLSTGTVSKSGITAPVSYSWSELQNNTGNTTECNKSTGFAGYFNTAGTSSFQLADDFTVPAGTQWNATSFDFFIHQNSFLGATIPVDELRIQIWNGDPSLPSSLVIAGNMTTNVVDASNSANTFIYRIPNSIIGSPAIAPNTNRKIWRVRGNIAATLNSGTYWVVYQFHATDNATNIFAPTVTVVDTRGLEGWNAKQNYVANTSPGTVLGWRSIADIGDPAVALDVAQDLPFNINGSVVTLNTNQNDFEASFSISPNPVKDIITFNSLLNKNSVIEIFDITGRKVMSFNFDTTVDVSELLKGNYIIKVIDGEKITTKKFIKE